MSHLKSAVLKVYGTILMPSILILVALSVAVWAYFKRSRWAHPLPPGPRKYPIIGNLLHVPTKYQWVEYNRLANEYNSDILHFQVFGNSVIVLNSLTAASDLLRCRSSLYSSRPVSTMVNEVMGWNPVFSVQPYGQRWRDRRRVFWQEFNPEQGKVNHRPIQLYYTRDLIRRIHEAPLDFQEHIYYTIGASILAIVYGLNIQEREDPNIAIAKNALHHLGATAITGTFIVDHLPILKHLPRWIPGAGFRILGDNSTRDMNLLIDGPYSEARKLLETGRGQPSFLERAFHRRSKIDGGMNFNELVIKETAAAAYLGGSETTQFAVSLFVGAMVLWPDVQAKAQEELDQYLDHRLPDFDDQPHLPYTLALMLEIMRWEPVGPLGLPHSLVDDDEYKGYHLPKDSVVFFNAWAILRDNTVFPEPERFNPSRFLINGEIDIGLRDYVMSVFGFGRRVCPGRHFAQDTLWITIASILTVFTISNATDEGGQPIVPDLKYTADLVRHVLPFKCSIKPRSDKAAELIERFCRS